MKPFDQHIEVVLRHEGGYVNDPADPGGETNFGISKRSFPKEDIKGMTKARAIEIYRRHFWEPSKADQVSPRLQLLYLDTAVNCGVVTAIRLLQLAAGIKDDGVFGPKTAEAAAKVTLHQYADQRLAYYARIITRNPRLAKFHKGWTRRVFSFLPPK